MSEWVGWIFDIDAASERRKIKGEAIRRILGGTYIRIVATIVVAIAKITLGNAPV